jgi:hypothetical protein
MHVVVIVVAYLIPTRRAHPPVPGVLLTTQDRPSSTGASDDSTGAGGDLRAQQDSEEVISEHAAINNGAASPAVEQASVDPTRIRSAKFFEVTTSVTLAGAIPDGARGRVIQSVQRYADELCSKITEVEKKARAAGVTSAEFTASHVIKADEAIWQEVRTKAGVLTICVNVSAPIFMGLAGLLGNYLHSMWQAALFGAAAALAVVTTVESVRRGAK